MYSLPSNQHKRQARLSFLWILCGIVILLCDQLSKNWVVKNLPLLDSTFYHYPYGGIGIFKNWMGIEFSINHMTNKGVAWGMLGNYQEYILLLRIFLISVLVVYLFYFNQQRYFRLPLLLITAGAIGNVADFFLYGHVIDMFHFVFGRFDFPVFNVADTAISLGVLLLFFISWKGENKKICSASDSVKENDSK